MTNLVTWLWQGIVIAGVTMAAVRIIPPASAARRHLIWWTALVFTLLLAGVEGLDWFVRPQSQTATAAPIETTALTLPMLPAWLTGAAIAFWIGIAVVSICRLAISFWQLRALVRSSTPLAVDRTARLNRSPATQTMRGPVALRVSSEIAGACAVGFGRRTILISSSLVALSDAALESVILHEQAHLQRYDDWTRAIQSVVLSLAGWHPGVLWISRQIDLEREIACDQRAIAHGSAPLAYARSLVQAAELIARGRGRVPLLAPGASTTSPMLRLRVERLLALPLPSARPVGSWASAAVAAAVASIAVGLSNVPHLITFSGVAASATLASHSFFAGVPRELPAAPITADADASSQTHRVVVAPGTGGLIHQSLDVGSRAYAPHDAAAIRSVAAQDAEPDPSIATVATPQLGALSIPFLARVPEVQSIAASGPKGVDWSGLARRSAAAGMAVEKAGTASGLATSRAGTTVGRFFKSGGLAIAKSF